ncbi:hypothetical protein BB559_004988 [Furculomyces boomerangus]|uniref:SRCR domain-containing protein n=1 Tax=Furculomyces boomerangus TaxID=61424 RepID=A0A2T9XY22_9FUNG|nr:hypothetical protein BB559_007281 [Furculomyces boomerangus]PVU89704.1 hypothetical protein BB559_004988 [Furculomyces boomerangus]
MGLILFYILFVVYANACFQYELSIVSKILMSDLTIRVVEDGVTKISFQDKRVESSRDNHECWGKENGIQACVYHHEQLLKITKPGTNIIERKLKMVSEHCDSEKYICKYDFSDEWDC